MHTSSNLFLVLGIAILAIGNACTYDQAPEPTISSNCEILAPTYENGVEELLERTCAYEGCHVSGFSSGNYTTYETTLPFAESIRSRTLLAQDMPPSYSPEGKPKTLSAAEKELLECWIANGTPEN